MTAPGADGVTPHRQPRLGALRPFAATEYSGRPGAAGRHRGGTGLGIWKNAGTPRVERDVASTDDSGAASTPTLLVNSRRHTGGHDHAAPSPYPSARRMPPPGTRRRGQPP